MGSKEEMSSIPIISLSEKEEEIASKLRNACIEHGFLFIEDHGVDASLIESVFDESKALFELSLEEKQTMTDPELSRGFTAMQEETLDPANQTEGDTKEGFYICKDIPKSDPQYNPAKLHGPNQWPSPTSLPNFRPVMEKYFEALSALGLEIVRLLALSLNLPKCYFDSMFDDPMAALRLLHYGPKLSDPAEGIYACGAHSDYGMITILLTDENPGLQILTKNNKWVDVKPMKGAFIVNLGDMLERWSNGLYRSTLHRVLTSSPSNGTIPDRYSVPFFYEPNFDSIVKVLETCHNEKNPPKYPPISSGEYLLSKYNATHADFTLSEK